MARTAKSQVIVIDVTQYDINHGKRGDGQHCPIHRAIKRTLKGLLKKGFGKGLNVTDEIAFQGPDDSYSVDLTKAAHNFIGTFDDNGKKAVKPFSFKVKFPVEALA